MSGSRMRRRFAALLITAAAGGTVVLGAATPASAVTSAMTSAAGVSPSSTFAVAACPGGTNLVGTGGQINNGNGNVVMTDVIPDVAADTVTVWGVETAAYALNWTVTAVAICEPVATVQVAIPSAFNGAATKTVVALCPGNTQLTGTGYELLGANGQVLPQIVQPTAGLGGVTVSATELAGFAPAWSVTAYAICAVPAGFAPQLFSSSNGPNGVSPKQAVTGNCPAGTTLFGVGGGLDVGGEVTLDQMVPDPAQNFATSRGDEQGAFPGNWTVTSYLICW
jgi:hypothetical protein